MSHKETVPGGEVGHRVIRKTICVDTGKVWIGDPIYAPTDDAEIDPNELVQSTGQSTGKFPHGLAVMSGVGDGFYEAVIELVTLPYFGERVKSVSIDFLPED